MLHYYAIIDLLLLAGYYGPLDWLGWVVNDCNDTNLLVASLRKWNNLEQKGAT
jgi:hypothetical protein